MKLLIIHKTYQERANKESITGVYKNEVTLL